MKKIHLIWIIPVLIVLILIILLFFNKPILHNSRDEKSCVDSGGNYHFIPIEISPQGGNLKPRWVCNCNIPNFKFDSDKNKCIDPREEGWICCQRTYLAGADETIATTELWFKGTECIFGDFIKQLDISECPEW